MYVWMWVNRRSEVVQMESAFYTERAILRYFATSPLFFSPLLLLYLHISPIYFIPLVIPHSSWSSNRCQKEVVTEIP